MVRAAGGASAVRERAGMPCSREVVGTHLLLIQSFSDKPHGQATQAAQALLHPTLTRPGRWRHLCRIPPPARNDPGGGCTAWKHP